VNKSSIFIALLLLSSLQFSSAEQVPWKLWKKNSSQSVSYRPAIINNKIDKKLIEIRASATVNSSMSGFLLFLQDANNTQHWLVNASESKIIKHYSVKENSFYIKLSQIWPLRPRILILHSSYWQNDDLSIEIKLTDAEPILLKETMPLAIDHLEEFLQVKTHSAQWKIIPKQSEDEGNEIFIEYVFIADGRGDTPKWLADHLALKSIWKSMRNIRRQLPKEKWQQKIIKGITELSVIPLTDRP
jgi:hypothetical protein